MRIVVLDDYQQVAAGYADWETLGGELVFVSRPIVDTEDLIETLAGAEAVVAMRERTTFSAARFSQLPDLRLLVTTGKVNASIDVEAARSQGITVCGTESTTSATPELTWGLILSVLRNIPLEDSAMRTGRWQTTVGGDLAGHRLGVIGLGRLGTKVARVGAAFGMDVVAWSQNLDADRAAEVGVQAVSKEELFETSDVLTIHYKVSERSRGIVSATELALMKPSSILINTSRAPLVETSSPRTPTESSLPKRSKTSPRGPPANRFVSSPEKHLPIHRRRGLVAETTKGPPAETMLWQVAPSSWISHHGQSSWIRLP